MKTNVFRLVAAFCWLVAVAAPSWGGSASVQFQALNRISKTSDWEFSTASNAGNQYALALADLTTLPSISSARTISIDFDCYIPAGSRWLIGIGDKSVRGTNANGSSKTAYNTDGLLMFFGTSDGSIYRVDGDTRNDGAFDKWVHCWLSFNKDTHTYSYTITDAGNTYFSGTDIATTVDDITVIEAYSWMNSTTARLGAVTVTSADLTGQFAQSSVVITQQDSYTQQVYYINAPTYSIVGVKGDLATAGVTIDSGTGRLSGLTAGGAVKVQATGGGTTVSYVLTVAYSATDYPGHVWNFYEVQGGLATSDGLKQVPVPTATTVDGYGNTWTAIYKYSGNQGRNPEWMLNRTVDGDNAFAVEETAGLVLRTGWQRFYLRNDMEEFTHVGIRDLGAQLVIPQLSAGDIVELMWRHDASGSGSLFTATGVRDLRGRAVDETFEITESAERTKTRYVGCYSFEATGGDVTFTLQDNGCCDIQSVRIYRGPYHPTMRSINQQGGTPVPVSMMVDNSPQEGYVYNYCNQLYSTATGPAMYVLKGYRPKTSDTQQIGVDYDHPGCVTGVNAALTPTEYTDEDAYPVSDEERTRLYELRKNIIGLEVYNQPWQSNNNSYNFGRIKASGGWGKVTIRMNNYTNDMKYLIGYTPDYTLNIGSAPHQTYPYTWDFTNVASQAARGEARNVYNIITNEDQYDTNWTKTGGGTFELNTDASGPMESQYVPGAVLVTTEKALSNYRGDTWGKYALDELDGLGVDGKISIDTDSKAATSRRQPRRAGSRIELLQMTMDDYKIANTTVIDESGETFVTDWRNDTGVYKTAGNGFVKFGQDKIEETNVATCGFSYKCDRDVTTGGGVWLQPARRLKRGDIVSIKAYTTSTPTAEQHYGLSLYADGSTTALATMSMPNGIKNTETELSYTVTEGDGLEGLDVVCLYRRDHSVYITEVSISGDPNADPVIREMYCETPVTLTIPDVSTSHRIYVSASAEPESVTGATAAGSDAAEGVWRYDVVTAGNVYLTFPMGARVYKIGVTDILKTMHPVGGTAWATESRNHSIDHALTGYFTTNDANAYTVGYDSYDLTTATVALTPILETGYVAENTGLVMRQDNTNGNETYEVPLFYPSYTREAADVAGDNMMVPVVTGGRQWMEVNAEGKQKFILTNVHWRYTTGSGWGPRVEDTDAAGFYRLHVWGDATRDMLPDNCAYLGVPEGELPIAAWNAAAGTRREGTLGIRELDDETTEISSPQGGQEEVSQKGLEREWYSLDGRRVTTPKRGLYISRGRVVSVK